MGDTAEIVIVLLEGILQLQLEDPLQEYVTIQILEETIQQLLDHQVQGLDRIQIEPIVLLEQRQINLQHVLLEVHLQVDALQVEA